jgi:hypothetical protein
MWSTTSVMDCYRTASADRVRRRTGRPAGSGDRGCRGGRAPVGRVDWTCAEIGHGSKVDAEKRRRVARREFIRGHHPDRGGDPDDFIAGLAALDGPEPTPTPQAAPVEVPPRVVFKDQPWPQSAVTALLRRLRRPGHEPPSAPR